VDLADAEAVETLADLVAVAAAEAQDVDGLEVMLCYSFTV